MNTLVYLSQTGGITSGIQERFSGPGGLEIVSRSLAEFIRKKDTPLVAPWFLLDFKERSSLKKALRSLRSSGIYGLSPVLATQSSQLLPGIDKIVTDVEDLLRKGKEIEHIVAGLPSLPENLSPSQKSQALLLRFLHTRNIPQLEPALDPDSAIGFSYHTADLFFSGRATTRDILEAWSRQHLFKKNMVEKINLCPSCENNKISFREVCGKCLLPKIERVALIHHYSCGLMAPEPSFVTGKGFFCPKCKRALTGIGRDYEIGSEAGYCLNCKTVISGESSKIKCLCLNCGTDSEPGELISMNIYAYELSPYGVQVGTYGNFPAGVSDYRDHEKGNLSWISFQNIVRAEIGRTQRYKRKCSILKIGLHPAQECRQCKRQDLWQIWQVMADMDLARTSDFVCRVSPDLLYVLLPETGPDKVKKFVERLKKEFIPLSCRDCGTGKLEISGELLENPESFMASLSID